MDQEGTRVTESLTIYEEIGKGGMGTVYRGYEHDLDKIVAVKIIDLCQADESTLKRFDREATIPKTLDHPNLVKVYGSMVDATVYALVMEYVKGETLKRYHKKILQGGMHMPFSEVVKIVEEIGSALDYLHFKGVVHRDVKPENVLIDNKTRTSKLTDYGLLKMLDDMGLTETGDMVGTPCYMAPELLIDGSKYVDHLIDIYALGCVTKELLIGSRALRFTKKSEMPALLTAIMLGHVKEISEHRLEGPDALDERLVSDLEQVVSKAMCVEPSERYQKAGDFVTDFLKVVGN